MMEVHQGKAADIYIALNGSDSNPGTEAKPLAAIALGIAKAKPGDTIHLAPGVYRQSAVFRNFSGEPGKPVILDGHGATLDGSEELDFSRWQEVQPGLYRNARLLPYSEGWLIRFYFIFDGQLNRMGRLSKGSRAPFKKPEDLGANEWTFVADEKTFYVRVKPGTRVRAPLRDNGVGFSGNCRQVTIRNLTSTHVWNDGFNIHGFTRDVRFENVRAIECGDDGISAHEDCEISVDGFQSISNCTGICHIQGSRSVSRRVTIQDCLGYDLYFLGSGKHAVIDSTVLSSAEKAVVVQYEKDSTTPCEMLFQNVVLKRVKGTQEILSNPGTILDMENVSAWNLNLVAAGLRARVQNCQFSGDPKPEINLSPKTTWSADRNRYDLKAFHHGDAVYTGTNFDAFRKVSGRDGGSIWGQP